MSEHSNENSSENNAPQLLTQVVEVIRGAIDEDWVMDFAIDAQTRLSDDLEIESIEMVAIAAALQQTFGAQVDIIGWLAGQDIRQLIALSVGDLTNHIAQGRGHG